MLSEKSDLGDFESYLEVRYKDQLNWYNTRSKQNKRYYNWLQSAIIAISAFLPAVAVLAPHRTWIITIASCLLAFLTTILKIFRFQENWISYRTTTEMLKRERCYYDAKVGDYSTTKNAEQLFVERIEILMSNENTLWTEIHRKKESEDSEDGQQKPQATS